MATYLNVPYSEKDQAKALGAKWDYDRGLWFVPINVMLEPFQKWLPNFEIGKKSKKKTQKKSQINQKSFGVTVGNLFPNIESKAPWED